MINSFYHKLAKNQHKNMKGDFMQDLKIIENELVPVYVTDTGERVVYGTELHNVLGVKTPYRMWGERRLSDCEAAENKDYEAVQICSPSGQSEKQHIIKLDTAKEMAMLERNEKGKQVRRYFIEVEKKYKDKTEALHTETSKTPAILTQIRATPKVPKQPDIPISERIRMMEIMTSCSADALPYVAALAKPYMPDYPIPIKSEPEPEEKNFSLPELIHDIPKNMEPGPIPVNTDPNIYLKPEPEPEPETEKMKRACCIGYRTPFDRKKLRTYLGKIHLSIGGLADKAGVNSNSLWKYLTGDTLPGFENRAKICEALGKPVNWLDGGAKR
jgi:phage anti-repressor protein